MIKPTAQMMIVLETSQIALVKAFMYLVTLTPLTLKIVTDNMQNMQKKSNRPLYPSYSKNISGL